MTMTIGEMRGALSETMNALAGVDHQLGQLEEENLDGMRMAVLEEIFGEDMSLSFIVDLEDEDGGPVWINVVGDWADDDSPEALFSLTNIVSESLSESARPDGRYRYTPEELAALEKTLRDSADRLAAFLSDKAERLKYTESTIVEEEHG